MVGAFAGGLIGGQLPGAVLMVAFAIMMIATAIAMVTRKPRRDTDQPTADAGTERAHSLPMLRTMLEGIVVGLITGIVGAGGGFLIVPALVLLGGLSMPVAVGTSLLVIAMKSFAGLAGYLTTVTLDWPLVAAVTAMAVLGALLGARLSGRIPADALQKVFGVFVLLTGTLVLVIELPPAWAIAAGGLGLITVVLVLVCRLTALNCPFGLGRPTPG